MTMDIRKIIDFVEENLDNEISLESLSKQFNYSEHYISRMFNRYVGMGVKEYQIKRRLATVAIELRNTKKPVSYISDTNGFSSSKYMSRMFKKVLGISPSEYRKGNTYLFLLRRREMKKMKKEVKTVEEICLELTNQSTNQDELLDLVGSYENCLLIKQSGPEIILAIFTENDKEHNLYQIDLNIMNGKYVKKHIFGNLKEKYKPIELYSEDQNHLIKFSRLKDNKELLAKLYFKKGKPKVSMMCFTEQDRRELGINPNQNEINRMNDEIEKVKSKVIKCVNNEEVEGICDANKNLVLLKSFGSEFVIIKLSTSERYFRLDTIYADLNEKIIENYMFFSSPVKAKDIKIRFSKPAIYVDLDNDEYLKSEIHSGTSLIADVYIEFPSGMKGTGSWDIDDEFDIG